jgi:PKHD-type hydroxylase|tara:strand:+ start:1547 stop:2185 length:639 start_codon:yes stop_codon:yes gene_type:complete
MIDKATIWVDAIDESHVNMAEYYYFENAFTDEEIKLIQEEAEKVPPQVGKTGKDGSTSEVFRKSEIRWLNGNQPYTDGDTVHHGDDFIWLYKKLWTMVEEANRNVWNFNLSHGRDAIQHTIYREGGGHYDWHMDCGAGMQRQRKVSLTVQLTDGDDYEGGELQLWRGQSSLNAPRGKGTVVIFPSYMMHRVTEVTKGTRESLVLWVGGDHYR